MAKPSPLVIVGPSGVGKSVVIRKLQAIFPDKFGFSVSHTTRGPRPGEVDGRDYHFTDLETMQRGVAAGQFIEHAMVHGNMYGTSQQAVEAVQKEGRICLLDIDVQGAQSVHEQNKFVGTRFVFLLPPSLEELERRLRGRGTETEERVRTRLGNAKREIEVSERAEFFDHRFVVHELMGPVLPSTFLRFVQLLTVWYPQLGALPVEMEILLLFSTLDIDGTGTIAASVFEQVLRRIMPSLSDDLLAKLTFSCETPAGVDYKAWLSLVLTTSDS